MKPESANSRREDTEHARGSAAFTAPWPWFSADERAAAEAVLSSGRVNYWTGNEARAFEQEYAAHLGLRYGLALANGSVALELPLRMWGISPGDEVIVTPRSFIASASCVALVGARPVFADVDRDSGNITAESIARVLTPNTRAIIPVHLGGWPCDLDPIIQLAEESGIKVLEDCAQAHGALYRGRAVGSIGNAAAFSFCQDKNITTAGEGGLLATNDTDLWERSWSFKDHGKNHDEVRRGDHPPGFRWLHDSFGTNWRMTELQAAIGRLQLRKLPQWIAARRRNAELLRDGLMGLNSLRIPSPSSDVDHAYYRFYFYVVPDALKTSWSRNRIIAETCERGVPCFTGSCSEIYLESAFRMAGLAPRERLPNAKELGDTSVALLVHPTLSSEQAMRAATIVEQVVREATR